MKKVNERLQSVQIRIAIRLNSEVGSRHPSVFDSRVLLVHTLRTKRLLRINLRLISSDLELGRIITGGKPSNRDLIIKKYDQVSEVR